MATLGMCVRSLRGVCGISRVSTYRSGIQRFGASTAANASEKQENGEPPKEETENATTEQKPSELEQNLTKQVEDLQKQFAEAQDKYKRSLAENENVRQRMKKQVDDAKLFGIQGFCKDLLEVSDILGQAIESVPKDEVTEANPHLKGLYDGICMTNTQLLKVFTKHGLTVINPSEGEKFNPHFHEALFESPVPGKTPGTVAMVTKAGYKLHDRTIRAAKVGVFKET